MDGKTLRDKLVGSDDERAVSPVIGVILMVAITVILAAVIATLVMDFGDSVNQEANAGVTIDTDGDSASISWTTSGNADVIDVGMSGGCSEWQQQDGSDNLTSGGATMSFDTSSVTSCQSTSGTITATAVTEDGTRTIVQTEDYNFD